MRQPPTQDERAAARHERRAIARQALHRRRRATLLGALASIALLIVLIATSGSSPQPSSRAIKGGAGRPSAPLGLGSPLSPTGYAALWAPGNVVGGGRQTDRDYAAASKLPGPGGYLLIADRGNDRIQIVGPNRKLVFDFPTAAERAAGQRLVFDDDVFVEPGGRALISNEEENHAIVQVGLADRRITVLFGHPGVSGPGPTHLNTPDDAYMLPGGTITVADSYNCRVLFIKSHQIVRAYGDAGGCSHAPPRHLGSVNGDTPLPDGGVLVSEPTGSWIDEIGPDGRLRFAFRAPVVYPSDPQPLPGGRILLADYANPGHILILDRQGRVLWRFGAASGYDRLDHPSLAIALPNGNIGVNDDYRDRIVVIDPQTKRIVWEYGHTGHPGTRAGYLNTPDGMDFIPAAPNGAPDFAAVVHP